jgi:hypothetical protein
MDEPIEAVGEVLEKLGPSPGELGISTFAQREKERVEVAFIEAAGKQECLKMALATSPSPKMQAFLMDLCHPRASEFSFSEIARHNNISPVEIVELLRDFNKSKTVLNMLARMPEVGIDVVADARSTRISCRRCDGLKKIESREMEWSEDDEGRKIRVPKLIKCPECRGKGTVRKPGDATARKTAFEATGIITKQPLVAIDQRQISIEQTLTELESIEGS